MVPWKSFYKVLGNLLSVPSTVDAMKVSNFIGEFGYWIEEGIIVTFNCQILPEVDL